MNTRFAPSPTGCLHLGNARTALFNYLLAHAHQASFLLRIEDTDPTRSNPAWTEQLQKDLTWLGLQWQRGPGCAEDGQGPYFQSQRQAIYERYYQQLQQAQLAYPCFCSQQTLATQRASQLASGQAPRYNGCCRHLTPEQIAQKRADGQTPSLRFRVAEQQTICFKDLVKDEQTFSSSDLGDFIIRRADGTAAFFFCNAVDDAVMGVTHVLRGEDHLTNTPRQILLLQALNLPIPHYGHMPLIIAPDSTPLSKRQASESLNDLREAGYLPAALQNYLSRLGHNYANDTFMTLEQLAASFSLANLGRAPAHYDPTQLLYWQKQAVQQLEYMEMWDWLGNEVYAFIPTGYSSLFVNLIQNNIVFPAEGLAWAKTLFVDPLAFSPLVKVQLRAIDPVFWRIAIRASQDFAADAKTVFDALKIRLRVTGPALFEPLRLALTGQPEGPELAKIINILINTKRFQPRLEAASLI